MIGYIEQNHSFADNRLPLPDPASISDLERHIRSQLEWFDQVLSYNHKHKIRLYQVPKDLIPQLVINRLDWESFFSQEMMNLTQKIQRKKIRLILRLDDLSHQDSLAHHIRWFKILAPGQEHKIVISLSQLEEFQRLMDTEEPSLMDLKKHISLLVGDEMAPKELITLKQTIKLPLTLEIKDFLDDQKESHQDLITPIFTSWQSEDGPALIYYEQVETGQTKMRLNLTAFLMVWRDFQAMKPDLLIKAPDTNLSAIKCLLATDPSRQSMTSLEKEWAAYKYLILYYSPKHYQAIRQLLKDKESFPLQPFYELLDDCLNLPPDPRYQINALDHIWGYFKKKASSIEKETYLRFKEELGRDHISSDLILKWLYELSLTYQQTYLKNSLIFHYHPHE